MNKMRLGELREERRYQQSGRFRYGLKPVLGATLDTLDRRRWH